MREEKHAPEIPGGGREFEVLDTPGLGLSYVPRSDPKKLRKGRFGVPEELSEDQIAAVAAHEYIHIALVEEGRDLYHERDLDMDGFDQAAMDAYVNMTADSRGIYDEIKNLPVNLSFMSSAKLSEQRKREMAARCYMSCNMVEANDGSLDWMRDRIRGLALGQRLLSDADIQLLENHLFTMSCCNEMGDDTWLEAVESIRKLVRFKASAQEAKQSLRSELMQTLPKGEPRAAKSPNVSNTINKMMSHVTIPGGGHVPLRARETGEWGEMVIKRYPMTKEARVFKLKRKRKLSFTGALVAPHRYVTDKMMWGVKRRFKGGTLLLDVSGSMNLQISEIERLLDERPLATVALYSGQDRQGTLHIVAEKGRRVDKLPYYDVYNLIDGPALVWMALQEEPFIWISDGKVNGCHGSGPDNLYLEASSIVQNFGITRYDNIDNYFDGYKETQPVYPRSYR